MEKYYYHIEKVNDGDEARTVLFASPIEFWDENECLPDGHENYGYSEMNDQLEGMGWEESGDAMFDVIESPLVCVSRVQCNPHFKQNDEFSKFVKFAISIQSEEEVVLNSCKCGCSYPMLTVTRKHDQTASAIVDCPRCKTKTESFRVEKEAVDA